MINFKDLTVLYGEYVAVDGLNLSVSKGELFAFLGPNGAGKTTTIKALTGLLGPDEGSISVGGHDMGTEPLEAKSIIGYVPDVAVFYDKLTSIEFMRFIGDLYAIDRSVLNDNTVHLFEKFDLNLSKEITKKIP